MSNPFANLISQNLVDKYNQVISEVLRANLTPARLIYPSTKTIDCTDCVNDSIANSPNPYLRGKSSSSCSVCGGTRKIQVETTENINIAVIFNYKKFSNLIPGLIVTADGDAQTISEIGTIKQLKSCKYIVFNTNLEPFNSHTYERSAEPNPMGFGDPKFILTAWRVIG